VWAKDWLQRRVLYSQYKKLIVKLREECQGLQELYEDIFRTLPSGMPENRRTPQTTTERHRTPQDASIKTTGHPNESRRFLIDTLNWFSIYFW